MNTIQQIEQEEVAKLVEARPVHQHHARLAGIERA